MRLTIARLLSQAQSTGQVSSRIDPDLTAQFIIGAATWAISWYKPSGRCSVDEVSELFIDLICRGIQGKPSGKHKTAGKARYTGVNSARKTLGRGKR